MEKFELSKIIETNEEMLTTISKIVNISHIDELLTRYNTAMQQPDFYQDLNLAREISQAHDTYLTRKNTFLNFNKEHAALKDLFLGSVINEYEDIASEALALNKKITAFKVVLLLNEPYDKNDAILEIHAGAGGVEAMDWVQILARMYTRYCEASHFKINIINRLDGTEAGYKSITFAIKGHLAYGYLKNERGVHRLVRISPFDANRRRHTSFASVMVYPQIDDPSSVEIKKEDLKIDTFYSSGAGGQSVNTTLSAVRITHLPTGIVVTCQNERSQIQNKANAINILRAKLVQLEIEKREQELTNLKGSKQQIMWGSQRRSYVFCPYQLVKDHLSNYETSKLDSVLDGNLNPFIYAQLLCGTHE